MITNSPVPLLILLSGPMRAGKDSTADVISSLATDEGWHTAKCSLGEQVKLELQQLTGVKVRAQERSRWRRVWQFWGTEVRRELFSQNWWLDRWQVEAYKLTSEQGANMLLVPDVRFLSEVDWFAQWANLRGWRVVAIRVTRGAYTWQPWRRAWWHQSEREWPSIPWQYRVRNTDTREMLPAKVRRVWEQIQEDFK